MSSSSCGRFDSSMQPLRISHPEGTGPQANSTPIGQSHQPGFSASSPTTPTVQAFPLNIEGEFIPTNSDVSSELSVIYISSSSESENVSEHPEPPQPVPQEPVPPPEEPEHFSRVVTRRIPQIYELFSLCFQDPETADGYLAQHGVFYTEDNPPRCSEGRTMALVFIREVPYWRCQSSCPCNRSKRTFRTDGFFYNRVIGDNKVLFILYLWLIQTSKKTIHTITGVNRQTVNSILNGWDQVLQEDIIREDVRIGGPGIVVQIDESKFGKRKYNQGHRVDGVWVVGGVETTDQPKMFLTTVVRRDAHSLHLIINEYVKPGSIIHVDHWRGYLGLDGIEYEEFQYSLIRINRSVEFVDSLGNHTNTIEGTWSAIKATVPPRNRNRDDVPWYLLHFIWRRKHNADLWGALLGTLARVSYKPQVINPPYFTRLLDERQEDSSSEWSESDEEMEDDQTESDDDSDSDYEESE